MLTGCANLAQEPAHVLQRSRKTQTSRDVHDVASLTCMAVGSMSRKTNYGMNSFSGTLHSMRHAQEIGLACQSQTVSDRHTLLHLQVEGVIDNLLYQDEFTMRARMSNGVCLTCTRRAGNYFEATVQLRSTGRRLEEEELNTLRASLDHVIENLSDDPMFFITSEGPVTGGYDVVLGSKGLARSWGRHLTDNWGGQVGETNTTVGRKDGVDVTRLTLLYRKPGYDLGDVVRWRGDYWRPSSWSKDGAIMERIARQERTGATWRDLDKVLVIAQMKKSSHS